MMTPVELLDIFLRGSAAGALALCALVFLLRGGRSRKGLSVILLSLGLCAYLLVSSPALQPAGGALRTGLILVAGVIPVLVYWAAIELFQDEVSIRPWQVAVGVLAVASAWLAQWQIPAGALRGVCVLLLFAHVLGVVIRGDAGDLIASRRRFRRWFLVWILALGSVITLLEVTHLDRSLPGWVYVMQAGAILGSAGAFLLWSVRIVPEIWIVDPQEPQRPAGETPAQVALMRRIDEAMAAGLWREEGLTVAQVAQRLGTQEHRVRSAINQGMGHRNFASYVNAFRIREAQELLAAPGLADRTVLSIAYEVGFASLGPFNRAFRAVAGMTPTEYRKQQIGAVDPSP